VRRDRALAVVRPAIADDEDAFDLRVGAQTVHRHLDLFGIEDVAVPVEADLIEAIEDGALALFSGRLRPGRPGRGEAHQETEPREETVHESSCSMSGILSPRVAPGGDLTRSRCSLHSDRCEGLDGMSAVPKSPVLETHEERYQRGKALRA